MSCTLSETFPDRPVWTEKSTSTWVFHPMTESQPSTGVSKVRASFALEASSGALTIRPALQMSNDGVTWDTAVAIGTDTLTADGTNYADSYEDMSSTTQAKLYVRFGIQATNSSGTALEMGRATLRIDCTQG